MRFEVTLSEDYVKYCVVIVEADSDMEASEKAHAAVLENSPEVCWGEMCKCNTGIHLESIEEC
jgi:hypothetical protein